MNLQTLARWAAARIGRDSIAIRTLRPAYERTLLALSGGHGIAWMINGEEFRIDPRRRAQFAPHHEAPVAAYLRARVRPGDVCYDVGANIGIYVLQLARWVGATGRVVAFEPNPTACGVLQQHARMNGVERRVTVVTAAVSDKPGRAQLHAAESDAMSRLDAPNVLIESRATAIEVDVITLDAFSATGPHPDWILIDVEGYELAVLRGARRLLEASRRPGLVVEMHPDEWRGLGESPETAAALLRDLRLRVVPLTGQSDGLRETGVVALEPESSSA